MTTEWLQSHTHTWVGREGGRDEGGRGDLQFNVNAEAVAKVATVENRVVAKGVQFCTTRDGL